ncbi:hypothetical protein AGJ34_21475 [Cronobacter dublinensis subsp. dublinensis]|nr:hypothetical protein [Cronobacter dublinensis subsp. dublinensis]EGT5729693.1 hypothetical protein [Cronobacter dublinensis subsp. dublinensis]
MNKKPDLLKAKAAIRKVALISSPATSQAAAEALIDLVRSGELSVMAEFIESVIIRKPDAYIERAALKNIAACSRPQIDIPDEGEEFSLSVYLPVFIGNHHDL